MRSQGAGQYLQALSTVVDQMVGGIFAQDMVELLQIIEVKDKQGCRAEILAIFEVLGQLSQSSAAVVEAGEAVAVGGAAQGFDVAVLFVKHQLYLTYHQVHGRYHATQFTG